MSPFVSIPRTPVPLISSGFVMPNSTRRRCTEGNTGREWDIEWDARVCGVVGDDDGGDDVALTGLGGVGAGAEVCGLSDSFSS